MAPKKSKQTSSKNRFQPLQDLDSFDCSDKPFSNAPGGSEGVVDRASDPVHPWLKHTRVGDTSDPVHPWLKHTRVGDTVNGQSSALSASADGCDGVVDVGTLARACIDVIDGDICIDVIDGDTCVDTRIDDIRNTSIDTPLYTPHTPPPSRPTFSPVVSSASIPSCKLTPIARSSPAPVVTPARPAAANNINNIGILKLEATTKGESLF